MGARLREIEKYRQQARVQIMARERERRTRARARGRFQFAMREGLRKALGPGMGAGIVALMLISAFEWSWPPWFSSLRSDLTGSWVSALLVLIILIPGSMVYQWTRWDKADG